MESATKHQHRVKFTPRSLTKKNLTMRTTQLQGCEFFGRKQKKPVAGSRPVWVAGGLQAQGLDKNCTYGNSGHGYSISGLP